MKIINNRWKILDVVHLWNIWYAWMVKL